MEPVHDRVEVPDPPLMFVKLREQARPVLGEMVEDRPTEFENPLIGETVMRSVPVAPASIVTVGDAAAMEKSGTATL